MKWKRNAGGGYLSEDGQLWIHRYWAETGHKTYTRKWWTLCVQDGSGWSVVDDVSGFVAAKEMAEQFRKEA